MEACSGKARDQRGAWTRRVDEALGLDTAEAG